MITSAPAAGEPARPSAARVAYADDLTPMTDKARIKIAALLTTLFLATASAAGLVVHNNQHPPAASSAGSASATAGQPALATTWHQRMTDTATPTRERPRRPSLYRTVLGVAVAALLAAWLPFAVFYVAALNKPATVATTTWKGGSRLVTTRTSGGQTVQTSATCEQPAGSGTDAGDDSSLMSTVDPTHQIFWFASRAFGIVAIVLLGISVALGLAMSGRLVQRRGLPAKLRRFHEAANARDARALIVVHAGLLLFDSYLRPGLAGITLPFAMSYRPVFTGIGIIGGWLAAILGLSFYARQRIGTKTWRTMHRFTIVVYLLALVHVIGAGTNGTSPWMIAMLTALTAPIVFAFTYRMLPGSSRRRSTGARGAAVERAPAIAGLA